MKKIILQGRGNCLRAAVIERDELIEVFEEEMSWLVGSMYRGRVENVLPGMQAAFVDIGLAKNAYLYIRDVLLPSPLRGKEEWLAAFPKNLAIGALLKPRQELVVQIIKEPAGNKGARVTTQVTLPGRYTVILPNVNYVGVSHKIVDEQERERLRLLAEEIRPSDCGLILRTMAEGIAAEEIRADIQRMITLWREIEAKTPHVSMPGLIHRDADLFSRLIRDVIDAEVDQLVVDEENMAKMLRAALKELNHPACRKVVWDAQEDLFAKYEIYGEIDKALHSKVWLKSGGYLVVQETEALVVIDVNTGKYTGKQSLVETVLHINLEAAEEIARQLRLRNLGGIIVIDFIDMETAADRHRVLNQLEQCCQNDKIKCQVLGLTKLGLVEMTRKRVGQTLSSRYTKMCSACDGGGRIGK
ncbi:MAG: Rne/Rng family ribonuclease [Peptococcaceae bacterium]|nr:Rne/Rng family ribonuclease [Peptococcaceae bacterium]